MMIIIIIIIIYFTVQCHLIICFFRCYASHLMGNTYHNVTVVKVNQSHYRSEVPRGFQEVKVPRLRDNGPEWW